MVIRSWVKATTDDARGQHIAWSQPISANRGLRSADIEKNSEMNGEVSREPR
jgi:hypothetical protein